jgi:hypothetical protein
MKKIAVLKKKGKINLFSNIKQGVKNVNRKQDTDINERPEGAQANFS